MTMSASHDCLCPYCIRSHTKRATLKGATGQEIMEAIWVAAEMRAGGLKRLSSDNGQHFGDFKLQSIVRPAQSLLNAQSCFSIGEQKAHIGVPLRQWQDTLAFSGGDD